MDQQGSTAFWQLTVIMIVIASWVFYRYAAPRGWREWSRAGLVQAFIVALYAEMYGFPLTIYVLSGFLGIDIPWMHESGHLWAVLFDFGVLGAMVEMVGGYALVFLGISLLVRGWRQVYQASREDRLVTEGLYGIVRHPQYTGILIALFGQLVHWPTIPTLILFPVIVWAYLRLGTREEHAMIERFGDAYVEYRRRVPAFVPPTSDWRRLWRVSSAVAASGAPAERWNS